MIIQKEVIGLIAGFLTTFSLFPQAFRIWRTRSVNDLSFLTYLMLGLGVFLWIIYGFLINSQSIVFANSASFFLVMSIIVMKICFQKKQK